MRCNFNYRWGRSQEKGQNSLCATWKDMFLKLLSESKSSPCFFVVQLLICLDQKKHCIPSGKPRALGRQLQPEKDRSLPTCASLPNGISFHCRWFIESQESKSSTMGELTGQPQKNYLCGDLADTEAKGRELLLPQTRVRSWKMSLQQVTILGLDFKEN